ncbi:Fusaric acid resistance protein-like [Actinacidiphila yanglinensis]|uniref:Fusaric acid resistance protein-like n=1 Tax=Actinacidiphila yanglinensis TaxID=310779 RepID=A0A1H5YNG8_9ACTN|nr:FUSC family protein [Actinacidiphila yanglinensis]SEG25689.1 Fusaric acid resistance protein-like [Actinacidiphila yanglinensis]
MAATGWISETWDRVVGSDPGLQRLRSALSAAVAMSTTLGLEYVYGRTTDRGPQGTLVVMLLGTVMAMMGSMALGDAATARRKAGTAVFFPVAIGAGMTVGVCVAGHTDTKLAVFVAVMFVAVFIRRFGLPFFFYGFMIWMGYFFASFLGATFGQLPSLLVAVALSAVWVLLLMTTVLRTSPQRTLARVRRAFGARARSVARVCADLLETGPQDTRRLVRLRRKLHSRQLRLAETALVIEGWSGTPGAIPEGLTGATVRRRVLDAHLAIDALATAADAMAGTGARHTAEAARIAGQLAGSDYAGAERSARRLLDRYEAGDGAAVADPAADPSGVPDRAHPAALRDVDCLAHHLATAAWEFTTLTRQAGAPGTDEDGTEGFEPAVTLAMGVLPGSAAVAFGVSARSRWNPLGRLSLTTRQAVQVAVAGTLAILVGRELSQARYYWAVIATFIAFTGTATRSETFIKASNRVAGTLVGLGAGIGLAHLTAGHTYWIITVIILSMSCGFYLVSISYAAMIFFVTIMVSQLYSELHEFTASLLMLRLEETAIGAAIGIGVALFVLPTSTRDTVNSARSGYYTALGELLRSSAARLGGEPVAGDRPGLDAQVRVVDHRLQQLALVARPLTRPLVWGNDHRLVRHRLTLYAAVTRQIRALASGPRRAPGSPPAPHLAAAARALADAATALALAPAPKSRPAAEVERALRTADAALLAARPAAGTVLPAVTRPLLRLRQLLRDLAVEGVVPEPPGGAGGASRVVAAGGAARRSTAPRPVGPRTTPR